MSMSMMEMLLLMMMTMMVMGGVTAVIMVPVIAVIAIFVNVIKDTFFYASFRTVLIVTAIDVDAIIVSRDTGLVTWRPPWDALASSVAFS